MKKTLTSVQVEEATTWRTGRGPRAAGDFNADKALELRRGVLSFGTAYGQRVPLTRGAGWRAGECRGGGADASAVVPAGLLARDVLQHLEGLDVVEVLGCDRASAAGLPPEVAEGGRDSVQRDLGAGRCGGTGEGQQSRLLSEAGVIGDELAYEHVPQRFGREVSATVPTFVSLRVPLYLRSSPSCWSSSRKISTGVVSISRLALPIQSYIIGTTSAAA